jgi:membrane protein
VTEDDTGSEPAPEEPRDVSLPDAALEGVREPAASGPTAAPTPRSAAPPLPTAPSRTRRRRDTLRGVAVSQSLGRRVQNLVRGAVAQAVSKSQVRRRVAIPLYALRVLLQVIKQWARDRCPQQAASLAFQTVLSIVPLLAVGLAALRATGSIHEESALIEFLAETYIPVDPGEIAVTLKRWSENVTFESLGLAGLLTTCVLAFVMFNTLERIMNDIWRTEQRRPLAQKFIVFYALITIVPLLLATSLYQASELGLDAGLGGVVLSLAASFGAAFFANLVLPKTVVQVRAAAAGALLSALAFELAKVAFNAYAENIAMAKASGIYGTVALAPLILVWIYYSWLVLLLGAEVAYAVQHLHLLERGERRGVMSLENELVRRVNGMVAARVMVAIAEAYLTGKKIASRRALADRFDLSNEVVDRIGARLRDHDLVIEITGDHAGYLPARPPHEITLAEVMAAFRGDDVLEHEPHAETRLDRVLGDLEADARSRTRDLYLDQLVEPAEPRAR